MNDMRCRYTGNKETFLLVKSIDEEEDKRQSECNMKAWTKVLYFNVSGVRRSLIFAKKRATVQCTATPLWL